MAQAAHGRAPSFFQCRATSAIANGSVSPTNRMAPYLVVSAVPPSSAAAKSHRLSPVSANTQNAVSSPSTTAARKFSTNSDPVTSWTSGVAANDAANRRPVPRETQRRTAVYSSPTAISSMPKFSMRAANSPPNRYTIEYAQSQPIGINDQRKRSG